MVTSEHEAKRPLARSREVAGSVGRGTAAAARGTGRFVGGTGKALWGPFMGLVLILMGVGVAWGASALFMEMYEFEDDRQSRAEYMDQVQEDAMPFWWIGALLVLSGVAVIAVDIHGKHVRDGMLGRRQKEER